MYCVRYALSCCHTTYVTKTKYYNFLSHPKRFRNGGHDSLLVSRLIKRLKCPCHDVPSIKGILGIWLCVCQAFIHQLVGSNKWKDTDVFAYNVYKDWWRELKIHFHLFHLITTWLEQTTLRWLRVRVELFDTMCDGRGFFHSFPLFSSKKELYPAKSRPKATQCRISV